MKTASHAFLLAKLPVELVKVYVGTELHCEPISMYVVTHQNTILCVQALVHHLSKFAVNPPVHHVGGAMCRTKCLLSVLVTHQIWTKSFCFLHVPCEPPKMFGPTPISRA